MTDIHTCNTDVEGMTCKCETNKEIIEEFKALFVDTEMGLDHAKGKEIRKAGEKLITALEAKDKELAEALDAVETVNTIDEWKAYGKKREWDKYFEDKHKKEKLSLIESAPTKRLRGDPSKIDEFVLGHTSHVKEIQQWKEEQKKLIE